MAKQPANLISQLDEAQLESLGIKTTRRTDEDLESRSDWESQQDKHFALWACDAPNRRGPWPNSANVTVPMVSSAINNWAGLTGAAIFDNPTKELVTTVANTPLDIRKAERVEKYVNWQLVYEQEGEYQAEYDRLLPHLAITGMAFKKIVPDYENESFTTEFVSSIDLIVPDDTRSLKRARRITHRTYQHFDEIEELADEGFYDEGQVGLLSEPASDSPEQHPDPTTESEKQRLGLDASTAEQRNHVILEQHVRGKIKGLKGDRFIVWVDYETSTVLRVVEHPKDVRAYFVAYHFIPSPTGGFHSYGFGHFLRPLNEIVNTLFNQYIDGGTISNMPMVFYGRSAGLRGRKIKVTPGGSEEISDVTQLLFTKFPGIDQNLPLLVEFVLRFGQDITANTDEVQGRAQKGVREPTVRGQSGRIGQAMTRFKVYANRVFRGVDEELRIIHDINRLVVSERKQFFILGSSAGRAFEEVGKDDFNANMHILTTANPDFASQAQRRDDATTIMQVALQSPYLGQNQNVMAKITDDWLTTMGRGDLTRYTPDPTPPPLAPEAENILFAQGEEEPPKTGEDHQAHIAAHIQFSQTPTFAAMPPEYQQILANHVQAHEIQQQQDERAQQRAAQEAEQGGQSANAGVGAGPAGPGIQELAL